MSFLSGSTEALPKSRPRLAGLDELRAATNEQARPIPYVAGTQRIGVTFLSQALGYRVEEVGSGGKGGKGGGGSQHDYYATFAAAICHGVVDTIHEIWMDDEQVWVGPIVRVAGEDYVDITVEAKGSIRLYWGTLTQITDPVLALHSAIEVHPAYVGLAYLVADQLLFGRNRNTAPTIECVVSRRPVAPGWFPSDPAIGNDCNPALVVWDLVTSARYGLGLPDTRIDQSSLNATAEQLEAEGLGLSVILTRQASLREVLVQILEHCDGYHRVNPDGTLAIRLVRPVSASADLPSLDEDDLVDEPVVEPGSWADTSSGVQIKFTNALRYWKEDVHAVDDASNLAVTGEVRQPVIERPWVTQPDLAARIAWVMALRGGLPRGTVSAKVRRSSVLDLLPGDDFKLFWGATTTCHGRLRVRSIELPRPGEQTASLVAEVDNAVLNGAYCPIPVYSAPTLTVLAPAPAPFAYAVQLPAQATAGNDPEVGFWVLSPSAAHEGWWAWRELPDTSFEQFGQSGHFAGWISVDDPMPAAAPTIDKSASVRVTILAPDTDFRRFPAADIAAGRVCMFYGNEWIQITAATMVAPGQYACAFIRGRFGTLRWNGTPGENAFLWNFAKLLRHVVTQPGNSTQVFKAQPSIAGRRSDLAAASPLSVIVDRSLLGPPAPLNLRIDTEKRSARWVGTADLLVEWDPAAVPALALFDRWPSDPADAFGVILDVMDGSLAVVLTVEIPAGTLSYTLPHADLVTALGTPVSFSLRARHRSGAQISPSPSTLFVNRI